MAQFFWVGGSGTWDLATTTNWSASSGGAGGAGVPAEDDDVYFDANSFSAANQRVRININAICRSLRASGVTNSPRLDFSSAAVLEIWADFVIDSGTFSSFGGSSLGNEVRFYSNTATGGEYVIDTNGLRLDCTLYQQSDGSHTLLSNLVLGKNFGLEVGYDSGDFDLNDYNYTGGFLWTGGATGSSLDCGSGTITLYSQITNGIDFDSTTTVDASEATIYLRNQYTGASNTIDLAGKTFNSLEIAVDAGVTCSITGANTFTDFILSTSSTLTCAANQTIENYTGRKSSSMTFSSTGTYINNATLQDSSTLSFTGSGNYCLNPTLERSSTLKLPDSGILEVATITSNAVSGANASINTQTNGTAGYIKVRKTTIETQYLTVRDITILGGGNWYVGSTSTDSGNNGGLLFQDKPSYTDDKQVFYRFYDSIGGTLLAELNNVKSNFNFSNEVNTAGSSISIDVAIDPDTALDSDTYAIDNHLEVYIKDKQAPAGIIIWQGYVASVEVDYTNNIARLTVTGYGNKLDKFIILDAETAFYNQTTLVTGFYDVLQCTPVDTAAYAIEDFATDGSTTTVSSVLLKADVFVGNARVKLFSSLAEAQNILTDNSIGTSVTLSYNTSNSGTYAFTFATPVTVSVSTTYYIRVDVFPDTFSSYAYMYLNGDNSPGASSGVLKRRSTESSWSYPSDTYNMYLVVNSNTEDTTITHTSTEISDIFKAVVDSFNDQGGEIIYTPYSIEDTGVSITHSFNTDKIIDGLNLCKKAAPVGWYWYIDQATNIVYFKAERTIETIDEHLSLGDVVKDIKVTNNADNIINTVYFTGGDTGGGSNLYLKVVDNTSFATYGKRATSVSDGRVTVTATAEAIIDNILDRYSQPYLTISAVVIDNNKGSGADIGYDIESLEVGTNIRFVNTASSGLWDSAVIGTDYWDLDFNVLGNQIMQVVRIDYSGSQATITLNLPQTTIYKSLADTKRDTDVLTTTNNPTTPS